MHRFQLVWLSNGFLLCGSLIGNKSSARLEAADYVALGRIKIKTRINCLIAAGKKYNLYFICLSLEIHAGQQKYGWMNTKTSIMQQCLQPEMYLTASKSQLLLFLHLFFTKYCFLKLKVVLDLLLPL